MNKKIIYTQKYQVPQQQMAGNMVRFYQNPTKKYQQVHNTMEYIPNFPRTGGVEFGKGGFNAEEYQTAIRRDENKYSLYKQPTRQYQDTSYSVTGLDTGLNLTDYSAQSPTSAQFGAGNASDIGGYANMVNFGMNAFSDPTKGINTNPNAGLQTTQTAPTDAPISTLEEDAPITFSQNFAGNSTGINQLDYQDYQDIINGTVPADAGMGGALGAGAQGAMTGLAAGGPVGAIVGFAVGTVGSMYGDKKKEDARNDIRASLTAQNQEQLGSSTAAMKKANDNELARFLV